MSVLPFPTDARRRAKVRGDPPAPPVEFVDIWTRRSTQVTASVAAAGQLEAELATDTCDADVPACKVRFSWSRLAKTDGDERVITEEGELTLAIDLVDALAPLVAKLVDQARRDGVLPRRE